MPRDQAGGGGIQPDECRTGPLLARAPPPLLPPPPNLPPASQSLTNHTVQAMLGMTEPIDYMASSIVTPQL